MCVPALLRRSLLSTYNTVSEHKRKFQLRPQENYGIPSADFHENVQLSAAIREIILRRMSLKSDNTCGQYGYKLMFS